MNVPRIQNISGALGDMDLRQVLSLAAALGLITYLFLPSLIILPVEGYEARLMWVTMEGGLYSGGPETRRSFVQSILLAVSGATGVAPWTVWQYLVAVLTPVSFFLTFLVVRRFCGTSILHFSLYTLAVPYWIITVQYPSDTSLAVPFFIGAVYLATRGKLCLVISGFLAVVAIRARADAFPLLVIVPMVIWMTRDTLKERGIDGAVFLLAAASSGQAVLSYYDMTAVQYLERIISMSGSVSFTDWTLDIYLKIFTVNSILIAPFYLIKVRRDIRRDGWIRGLWILAPIVIYVIAYRNLMTTPRYFAYVAPFVMMMLIFGTREAIHFLKGFRFFRKRWVIPTLIGLLLFNPILHVMAYDDEHSENVVERVSRNYEKLLFSYVHTGLLPGLNIIYRKVYLACFEKLESKIESFLSSDKKALALFGIGNDSENNMHHRVYKVLFEHYGISQISENFGDNNPFKRTAMSYDDGAAIPPHEASVFRYAGKSIVMFKIRGPLWGDAQIPEKESWAFARFMESDLNSEPKLALSDFKSAVSFNLYTAPYPKYLEVDGQCRFSDRGGFLSGKAVAKAEATRFPPAEESYARALEERAAKNAKWLADIPDYELRLFERLQKVNHRTVLLKRVAVFGFILVLFAVPFAIYVFARKSSRKMLKARPSAAITATDASTGDHAGIAKSSARLAGFSWTVTLFYKVRLARLAWRQNRIEKLYRNLEARLESIPLDEPELQPTLAALRDELKEMNKNREEIEQWL